MTKKRPSVATEQPLGGEGWTPYSAALALHVAAEAVERAVTEISNGNEAMAELTMAKGIINFVSDWLLSGSAREVEFGVDK